MSKRLAYCATALLLAACASRSTAPTDADAMLVTASALTKLAAAVEATVRYNPAAMDADDASVLAMATRDDPALLATFARYKVRLAREQRHAVLLVCTSDAQRALLEDAGCSGQLDAQRWQDSAAQCEFTVTVAAACTAR